jgi:Rho-binding antiterminator
MGGNPYPIKKHQHKSHPKMIPCHQHDYVEIACMYRFAVRLLLRSGEALEGIAMDTQLNAGREECIKLKTGGREALVVLTDISRMEAVVANPHFDVVGFD